MKRICHKRNSENESDDGNTRNDKRSRRRLQSLEDSTSNEEPTINASTIDDFQSDDAKNESYASLLTRHQDSQHSIETLDEAVRLPEYVKVHTNTLTFPEKLMIALTHVERECAKEKRPESEESIGWVLDGKAFVVQNIDRFCETWLPMFFGQAKFSSFTRKLYRWGFRKINIASIPNRKSYSENALFFGSAHFLRDDKSQLSLMRSVTAAKTRSSVAADALKQAWTPTESHESATEDSKPKARQEHIPVDVTNSNTAYQQTNLTLTGHVGGENVSVLLQQAVNLAALQSLLQSNQHADRTTSQTPIFIGNHMMDESLRRQLTQQQNPPILQVDMFQALQQLALSAALTASGSISHTTQRRPQAPAVFIPQTFGTLPSLINSTIPVTHVNGTMQTNQQARGWSSEGHLLDARLPVSHDPAEEERLRRVIEAFLQYCRSVQQRQDAPSLGRNPRAPPP